MENNTTTTLFLVLGVILIAARIAGALARRLGQPRVLGELVVGVLLGPTLLDLLHWPILHGVSLTHSIREFGELGVLLLMFIVGLEVQLSELAKVGRVAGLAGLLGALVPVALTIPLVLAASYSWQPALFAGVTLAATSVSISAQVLLELGLLRSKVGSALLAAALIDDVLAILLVSLAVALVGTGGPVDAGEMLGILVRMTLFIAGAFLVAWYILPRVINRLSAVPVLAQSYGLPIAALVCAFVFGWAAQELGGVAAITGAFIAGVGLSRVHEHEKRQIEQAGNNLAYALFVPIFFVDVGLQTDLRTFPASALPLAILLFLSAVISKIGGCGIGARLGGFNNRESFQLGVCMISRGEVGLIISALGVNAGVFKPDQPLFAALFLVILLTTLITPILVRYVFPSSRNAAKAGA